MNFYVALGTHDYDFRYRWYLAREPEPISIKIGVTWQPPDMRVQQYNRTTRKRFVLLDFFALRHRSPMYVIESDVRRYMRRHRRCVGWTSMDVAKFKIDLGIEWSFQNIIAEDIGKDLIAYARDREYHHNPGYQG
jgi:hypothetical protein